MLKTIPLSLGVFLIAVFSLSYVVDSRRVAPEKPQATAWWPEASPRYESIHGVETRYISHGNGPDLLLLHTFSTELGHFRKVAEELSEDYRVWALDLPGFGYSDLPSQDLTAQYYVDFVAAFLEHMDLTEVTIVGESIGGTIPIALSAQGNERVTRILSLDPVGIHPSPLARSSRVGAIFTSLMGTPVLSGFIQRIRNQRSTRGVFVGAMHDIANMPDDYFDDLIAINQRPEFPKAQKSFIDNFQSWTELVHQFGNTTLPVHVMWGNEGWSRPAERREFVKPLTNATSEVVENAGHFISLDRADVILRWLQSTASG
ncbi:MAG: alpha/beta hydrolase [Pseudomonadota bacterium]